VICAGGAIRFRNVEAVAHFEHNICFSGAGQMEGVRFKDGMYRAQDMVAIEPSGDLLNADPLFVDAEKGDYRFKLGSPALELGIEPIDASRAGRQK
jgi:hypothetical protein